MSPDNIPTEEIVASFDGSAGSERRTPSERRADDHECLGPFLDKAATEGGEAPFEIVEGMRRRIQVAVETGYMEFLVGTEGVTKDDRVKTSAHRALAEEQMGCTVGSFKYNRETGLVRADIAQRSGTSEPEPAYPDQAPAEQGAEHLVREGEFEWIKGEDVWDEKPRTRSERLAIDEANAKIFWETAAARLGPQVLNLVEQMQINIQSGVDTYGHIGCFAGDTVTKETERRLSAYRKLAQDMGHTVGRFKYHPHSHTTVAQIRP